MLKVVLSENKKNNGKCIKAT